VAYKNYLQVDIVAADADDLLAWKGWVESRFRQLTLKVKSVFKISLGCRSELLCVIGYYFSCIHCSLNILHTGGRRYGCFFLLVLFIHHCADRKGHKWDAAVPSLSK